MFARRVVALEVPALARSSVEADHVGRLVRAARDAVGVGEDPLDLVAALAVELEAASLAGWWCGYTSVRHGGTSLWPGLGRGGALAGPNLSLRCYYTICA